MRESIFVRLESDPIARFWNGVGDIYVPADTVETEGALYLGGADLVSVPDFQQLINGAADRIEFTLSGVSAEVIALAVEEAASVKGAALYLGTLRFDDDWQQLSIAWEAQFRCDTLTTGSQPSDTGRTRTLSLSVGTDETGRSRAPLSMFTDQDQRRFAPTDAFFDHVAGINTGTSRKFGPDGSGAGAYVGSGSGGSNSQLNRSSPGNMVNQR